MADTRAPDEAVTLRTLHDHPGEAVDRVRYQGKHILITRSSKPAAMLVPLGWWRLAVIATDKAAELTAADIEAWQENDETGEPDGRGHQDQAAAPADEATS